MHRWLAALRSGSLAFYLASLSQIPVVALGDGCISVPKALYFANVTLDIQFLFAIVGTGMVFLSQSRRLYGRALAWAKRKPESGVGAQVSG